MGAGTENEGWKVCVCDECTLPAEGAEAAEPGNGWTVWEAKYELGIDVSGHNTSKEGETYRRGACAPQMVPQTQRALCSMMPFGLS